MFKFLKSIKKMFSAEGVYEQIQNHFERLLKRGMSVASAVIEVMKVHYRTNRIKHNDETLFYDKLPFVYMSKNAVKKCLPYYLMSQMRNALAFRYVDWQVLKETINEAVSNFDMEPDEMISAYASAFAYQIPWIHMLNKDNLKRFSKEENKSTKDCMKHDESHIKDLRANTPVDKLIKEVLEADNINPHNKALEIVNFSSTLVSNLILSSMELIESILNKAEKELKDKQNFLLGYICSYSEILAQKNGGEKSGLLSESILTSSLNKIFGEETALVFFDVIVNHMSKCANERPMELNKGLIAGNLDATNFLEDQQKNPYEQSTHSGRASLLVYFTGSD